uniref:Uncharacterized protein isoform X1 n=1 Tax=Nicotiana tabacum TaxID=4097 RepID=A0A1S4DKF2_TOBAC|nr:PREDICTED: uncharacterized protein LOC107830743 isoform X1 [Nicotiana tabacum]
MENSLGAEVVAVFAVSGSIVLLALKVHKHLLSDFMKKIEFEIRLEKDQQKKKVKFSNEVMKLGALRKSEDVDNNPKKRFRQEISDSESMESMPLNRQALYKGILQYKALKGYA